MKTSEAGLCRIREREGLALTAEYCQAGKLTIGYGHTNLAHQPPHVTPGMTITAEEAEAILASDLRLHEGRVARLIGPVAPTLNDVLVSFDFNTGGLTIDGGLSGVGRAAKAGDIMRVTKELARWTKYTDEATGKKLVSKGLALRRGEEIAALLADPSTVTDVEVYTEEDAGRPMPQAVAPPTGPTPITKDPKSWLTAVQAVPGIGLVVTAAERMVNGLTPEVLLMAFGGTGLTAGVVYLLLTKAASNKEHAA